MPNLFRLSDSWLRADVPPAIATPLGDVALRATLGEWSTATPPTEALAGPFDSKLLRWQAPWGEAELLLCRPAIDLPGQLAVSDAWAGLWRVALSRAIDACTFEASWSPGYGWTDGGPGGGQGLEAQTWTDGATEVSLGTESGSSILARAQEGRTLPLSWGTPQALGCSTSDCDELVRYTATGFFIALPSAPAGARAELHFAVAWSPARPDDASTWFAVDLTRKQILDGLRGFAL